MLDQNFGGLNVVHVMIKSKGPVTDNPQRLTSIMSAVESVLRSDPRLANVRSFRDVVANLDTETGEKSLAGLLDELPPSIANRL